MEDFVLLSISGIMIIYFYANMSQYKTLYAQVNEEKNQLQNSMKNLHGIIDDYKKQVRGAINSLNESKQHLQVARDDLQKSKLEVGELKGRNKILQQRVDDLYAQVNAIS